MTSSEFRANYSACLKIIHASPILISKAGRPAAVLISVKEYEQLQFLGKLRRVSLHTGGRTSSDAPGFALETQTSDALFQRLSIIAARSARTVGELIHMAMQEKIADWEELANIDEVLRGRDKRWTLSDLRAGKDLRHE